MIGSDFLACREIVQRQHSFAKTSDLRIMGPEYVDFAALRADQRHLPIHQVFEWHAAVFELDARRRLEVLGLLLIQGLKG